MDSGQEPIADDELLYRRIPASTGWYDSDTDTLKPEAFGPHKTADVTGLSVSRAKYKSIEETARSPRPGKSYYVAILKAAELKRAEIQIVPRPETPDGYDPAHAELPDLNSSNRKVDKTLELQRTLVSLCVAVEGPFSSSAGQHEESST